jgi:hypothetical protein
MARDEAVPGDDTAWPYTRHWAFFFAGPAATLLALLLSPPFTSPGIWLRVPLLAVGLLATGIGVAVRLRTAAQDRVSRLRSAAIVALAAVVAFLGSLALDPDWDSGILLLRVASVVALAGAGLVALPQVWRRAVLSLLVLFHFGGIVCVITAATPGAGHTPWLPYQLWSRVYRPYLDFLFLSEHYRFFSPDPPPAPLLWFHLSYADGSGRWVRLPRRDQGLTSLEFHRMIKLTESVRQLRSGPELWFGDIKYLYEQRVRAGAGMPLQSKLGGVLAGGPWGPLQVLPWVCTPEMPSIPTPTLSPPLQYAEPTPYAKFLLAAYVRHVACTYPHPPKSQQPITGIKVYSGVHRLPTAEELAGGMDPGDETLYLAHYVGDFDADGHIKLSCYGVAQDFRDGQVVKTQREPFLYWRIPIRHDQPAEPAPSNQPFPTPGTPPAQPAPKPFEYPVINHVRQHAGDKDEVHPGW